MFRIRLAVLAALAAGLLLSTLATAAPHVGPGGSMASIQTESDPGVTKPPNCGTPNTPPCEA